MTSLMPEKKNKFKKLIAMIVMINADFKILTNLNHLKNLRSI